MSHNHHHHTTYSYLDAYCERAGDPAFWAEPLNAVTNLAFIIVGWLAYKQLRNVMTVKPLAVIDIWILTLALFAIGIGSGLWHTYAVHWAVLADVIPIVIFINVYIISIYRRLFALPWLVVIVIWAVFQATNISSEIFLPRDMLNGSIMYVPALAMLVITSILLKLKRHPAAQSITITFCIFVVSLTFRTIDLETCDTIPFGTHFLWHILNAMVLYRLLCVVINDSQSHRNKNTTPDQS